MKHSFQATIKLLDLDGKVVRGSTKKVVLEFDDQTMVVTNPAAISFDEYRGKTALYIDDIMVNKITVPLGGNHVILYKGSTLSFRAGQISI